MDNKCVVTIEGVGMGILFNNPASMFAPKEKKKKEYDAAEEAEKSCYWNVDKSSLVFPAWNLYSGLVRAATGFKAPLSPKKSLAPLVAGDVSIQPDFLSFNTKEYVIDSRRAVVQRQGIIRHRAKLPKWLLTFELEWESSTLGKDFHVDLLPNLLATLGESIGIGDFRPMCKGPFGKFEVMKIEKI